MKQMSTLSDEMIRRTYPVMSLKLIRIERLKLFATQRALFGPVVLGAAIGKSTSQASDLLSGTASFGEKVARSIEEFSQLPTNWLDSLHENGNIEDGPVLRGRVPILSNIQAGMYKEQFNNYQPTENSFEFVSTSAPVKRFTFALRVQGDSMEPEFSEGMILIVEPELDPLPGDFVIAKNSNDETTFKKLVQDSGDYYLQPLNTRYPIKPLGESTIVGVVRAVEKRYR